jgi:Ca-activated chloride channel homolog
MPFGIDLRSLEFASPEQLWLLAIPGVLLGAWIWRLFVRRAERQRFARGRTMPVRERIPLVGGLAFWLWVNVALALVIVALANPRAVVSTVRTTGVDVVVLQDGSASMHVKDVEGNRWQRATRFLRVLAESISWERDRLAMAVFARMATPQVRLTRDPNTFFFFIDHLGEQPPFRLEDDTTWDTNIESGIDWGLKLFEKDEQLHGRSPNAKAFLLLSDGQAWSGEVADALAYSNAKNIPVWVIGVGTTSGGLIPEPTVTDVATATGAPIHSVLDRESLATIASRSGGQYFELGRGPDFSIASQIVQSVRRSAPAGGVERAFRDLHWNVLVAAAFCLCLAVLFLQEPVELWIHAVGAAVALGVVVLLMR